MVAANPYIVADGHGLGPFPPAVALLRIRTVASGVDTDVGADKTVVPNGNRSLVQHREIEVGKEAFAHPDLFAVIAVERLVNADMVVANVPQQAFQDGA